MTFKWAANPEWERGRKSRTERVRFTQNEMFLSQKDNHGFTHLVLESFKERGKIVWWCSVASAFQTPWSLSQSHLKLWEEFFPSTSSAPPVVRSLDQPGFGCYDTQLSVEPRGRWRGSISAPVKVRLCRASGELYVVERSILTEKKTLSHSMSDFTPLPLQLFSSEEKVPAPVLLYPAWEIPRKIYSIICNFYFLFSARPLTVLFVRRSAAETESRKSCFFCCRSLGGCVCDVCIVSNLFRISNLATISELMEPTATSPFAHLTWHILDIVPARFVFWVQLFFHLFLAFQRVFCAHLSLLQQADSLLGFFFFLDYSLQN